MKGLLFFVLLVSALHDFSESFPPDFGSRNLLSVLRRAIYDAYKRGDSCVDLDWNVGNGINHIDFVKEARVLGLAFRQESYIPPNSPPHTVHKVCWTSISDTQQNE